MSDINKYLGPHIQTGPNSYELAPISVSAVKFSNLDQNRFFSGNWGLTEGPHRGTSQGSGKLSPLTPLIWDDLMHEQKTNTSYIDSEYIETFNRLAERTNSEIQQARQAAKGTRYPSVSETAKIDQETTIQTIQSKALEYQAHTQSAYSLYGHNPFFLMKDLSFNKIRDSLETSPPDVSAAYSAIDKAYRSALELKRTSLQANILANQLDGLAARRNQADAGSTSIVAERVSVINQETNIRFQLLPSFLLEKFSTTMGVIGQLTLSQSLTNYRTTINKIIASEQAAIGPYATANPAISSPLSKPELEALRNLVYLQANTNLGKRWQDYHVSLLHSETARYLTETTNSFSGLIARAQEAERLQEQLRIAAEQGAQRLQEQRRIAAEQEAQLLQEQQRIAAEQEAQRLQEQRRIAAEQEAHRQALERAEALAVARRAERETKQKIASELADRFDEMYQQLSASHPDDIDQRLQWLKKKRLELSALNQEATRADRIAGPGFGYHRSSRRWASLRQVKSDIDALIRKKYQIENLSLPAVRGAEASVKPLVTTPDGLIAGYENLPISFGGAVDLLNKTADAIGRTPIAMLFGSVFYSPSVGNGELQRNPVALSIPLSQLPNDDEDEDYSYLPSNGNVTIPFRAVSSVRGEHTQLYLSETGGRLSHWIRVRKVKLDPLNNLYTFTTEGLLPRTLTWTPNNAPGGDALGSTELPSDQTGIRIYPGARVTQVEGRIDDHPTCDEADSDDYILWFPEESGIEPVYVMLSRTGPRYEPGTATGVGQTVGENWLGSATEAGGAPIPAQIADQLRGQDFRNFDKFREGFWGAVSNDPELSKQLSPLNNAIMKNGYSPYAPRGEQVRGREKFEIHHVNPIQRGGEVYNIDNMVITTPKSHIAVHSKNNGESL